MLIINKHKDILIASFEENINKFNILISEDVKKELNKHLIKKGTKLILDLHDVDFIDSSGFGALVSAYKTSKLNNSFFKICNVSDETMELVQITKLDKVFDIYDKLDDCINSFD
ncbi:MAG: anti-sigma factor antagonist [Bacteroidetes bacterium]|nr:MAG: anti-sigma factor antagonist [Bacteroidota bacterium]